MRIFSIILPLMLLCTSCARYPQDPRHTLDRVVAGGKMRVGVQQHEPWVTGQSPQPPGGLEEELIVAFADELGVGVEWHWGSGEVLFEALSHHELDVVIGGITESSPWRQHVAFTVPYYSTHLVVGVPPTAPVLTDLTDVTIAVQPESGLQALLQERGALVITQADLAVVNGPVAAEEWRVVGLGLRPSEFRLRTVHHVMAAPPGENAWLMRLEDFLLQHVDRAEMAARLWEATQP